MWAKGRTSGWWIGMLAVVWLAGPRTTWAAEDDPPADAAVAGELPPPPEDGFGPPHRGEMGRGPRAGVMLWRRMSEQERTELKQFIADEYPEMYDRLLETQASDSDLLERWIGRILPEMIRMKELKTRDPELFKVRKSEQQTEFELRRLARRYRVAMTEEERTELAAQIRPLVEKQFDIRQRRMGEEIDRLEERVEQLRQRIAKQAAERDAEVEKMYQRILEGVLPGDGELPDGDEGGFGRRERGRRGPAEGMLPAEAGPQGRRGERAGE